jgi:hypothetical protein
MDITNNILERDLEKVISECDFIPKRFHVVVTLNQFIEEHTELELNGEMESMLSEYQYIISSGEGSEYKPGDKILLDMKKLIQRVPDPHDRSRYIEQIDVNPTMIGDKTFTVISDSMILGKKIKLESLDIQA